MREGRKKEASKGKQTNKAKQHSTPKAHLYMYFVCVPESTVENVLTLSAW